MTAPVPDQTEAWFDVIFSAVQEEALKSGWFDSVNGHELVSPPGNGLTCAVWVQAGPDPVGDESGLAASSALLTFFVRIYTPEMQQPRDEIDPAVSKAAAALMRRWHDNYDFGLHPLVRNVDLLGQSGTRLQCVAQWIDVPGGGRARVVTITLPIIVNDVFPIGASA